MKKLSTILCVVWLLVFVPHSFSNNISVSNVSLEGQVVIDHYCLVEFDLSWDNSWRTTSVPQNWDAAWIFIKYSVAGGPWHHAKIDPAGSVQPAGCILDFADNTGVFIYRDADGNGTFSVYDIGIRWSYGDNGVPDDASVEVKVFAVEMVYVPEGAYYLGDGGSLYSYFKYPNVPDPFYVDGSSILCSQTAPNLWAAGNTGDGMNGYSVPSTYPTGYDAFYCMKYEISQEQYTDFLNNLTRDQQNTRTQANVSGDVVPSINEYVMSLTGIVYHRSSIATPLTGLGTTSPITFYCNYDEVLPGNQAGDGQNIACNYISWMDLAAYADWSGLRPMTEGEYEKACRGPNNAVQYEFAYGNAAYSSLWFTFLNEGAENETINNMTPNVGNMLHSSTSNYFDGPGRCGIFAASSANHTRVETGATYYGIMEMSGNLREIVVCMFNWAGLSYTGLHGDGTLTATGNANTDYWPGINNNSDYDVVNGVYSTSGVENSAGATDRGGNFSASRLEARVSDRVNVHSLSQVSTRYLNNGGRLIRSEP